MSKEKLVPKKKVVPSFIPYLCALMYVLFAVTIVICFIEKNPLISIINVVIVVILLILNGTFAWYKSAEIYEANNCIVYEVKEVIGVLGRDVTKYHIYRIDTLKTKGNKLILHGAITVYEPMRKGKEVKCVVVHDYNEKIVRLLTNSKFNIDKH